MAIASLPMNPVRDGFALMTPVVLRAIDALARTEASRVFEVKSREDMRGFWGTAHHMVGDVFYDIRMLLNADTLTGTCANVGVLEIAAEIEVAKFQSAMRPEIDLSTVPAERICAFVALHEIGHVCDNYPALWAFAQHPKLKDPTTNREWMSAMHKVNEVLADRFAWGHLFPGVTLPNRDGCEDVKNWVEEWTRVFEGSGIRRGMSVDRKQLNSDPATYVPLAHVTSGIPWSSLLQQRRRTPKWLAELMRASTSYARCILAHPTRYARS